MPVVQYRRQNTIPAKTTNALSPDYSISNVPEDKTGEEITKFGEVLSNVASKTTNILLNAKDRIDRQDAEVKFVNMKNAYDDDERTFSVSEIRKTGLDTYDNADRADEFYKQSLEKYTKDETNSYLIYKLKKYISASRDSIKDKLAAHKEIQRLKVTESAVNNSLSGVKKDVYEGSVTVDEGIAKFNESVMPLTASGIIGEEKGAEIITKATQQIAEAHLDGVINRNPTEALRLINSGVYKKYMKQEQIEEYDKKAKKIIDQINSNKDKLEKKIEKQIKQNQEQNFYNYMSQIIAPNQPSPNDAEIDSMVKNRKLNPKDGVRILKAKYDDNTIQDNPEIVKDLRTKLSQFQDIKIDIDHAFDNEQLSISTYQQLLKDNQNRFDSNPEFRRLKRMIERAIVPTGLQAKLEPLQGEKLNMAWGELYKAAEKKKDLAESAKLIIKRYQSELPSISSFPKSIFGYPDNIESLKAMIRLLYKKKQEGKITQKQYNEQINIFQTYKDVFEDSAVQKALKDELKQELGQ